MLSLWMVIAPPISKVYSRWPMYQVFLVTFTAWYLWQWHQTFPAVVPAELILTSFVSCWSSPFVLWWSLEGWLEWRLGMLTRLSRIRTTSSHRTAPSLPIVLLILVADDLNLRCTVQLRKVVQRQQWKSRLLGLFQLTIASCRRSPDS